MAIQHITHCFIYAKDQNECLAWYQDKLRFIVCDDNKSIAETRWLTISPALDRSTQFVLKLASNKEEKNRIGRNSMCVLNSDNCYSDCELFEVRGVEIVSAAKVVPWGITAVIKDLYGNPYTVVELKR